MSETIKCLDCTADIDTDSCYCDQCGKEIFLCETCAQPGNQKFCEFDGGVLAPAKQRLRPVGTLHPAGTTVNSPSFDISTGTDTPPPLPAMPVLNSPPPPAPLRDLNTPSPIAVEPVVPGLKLTNNNLNITLDIQPGDVLGRNTGAYAEQLKNFSAISGKHLVFKFEPATGWAFQDVGSTNGTKYAKSNISWNQVGKCTPGEWIRMEDEAFLLMANIEFALKIEQPFKPGTSASNTTQRI
ncbi:FHA domain-containing protein [Mucilaginibacter paludis]|uniref:FHA domain-containing protein n=1 Tax=Mucilaginibacter paludis DSM 18603 TaxID=714943 RepID=H1Y6V0_9SPHI|nr:FHA domain-containing protein [Mucilaginibacter paludis]EHQ28357.1 hypothetical protein Mucpa_4267 [Mucilaginibacter paludis DSM 18603]